MMRIAIRLTALVLLGTTLSLSASANTAGNKASLTPYSAEYRVKISVLGGRLRTNLQRLATGYRAESEIEATGLSRIVAHGSIRESSVFEPSGNGLRPIRFVSVDTLTNDAETVDLGFDWDAGVASGLIDNAEFSTPIAGRVLDRVSLQYGLMYDLLNGIERDKYFLQDAEKFKELLISNAGVKTVNVPFGRFKAVGIQHHAANSSRVTTLWCAEELGYLPVIIEQHRDGKLRMRAVLTEYFPATAGL